MKSRINLMKVTTDMTTLYGISNCDTCRKAKNWFNENRITFDFFDFRKNEKQKLRPARAARAVALSPSHAPLRALRA